MKHPPKHAPMISSSIHALNALCQSIAFDVLAWSEKDWMCFRKGMNDDHPIEAKLLELSLLLERKENQMKAKKADSRARAKWPKLKKAKAKPKMKSKSKVTAASRTPRAPSTPSSRARPQPSRTASKQTTQVKKTKSMK